jgi:hypothetical protein
MPKPKVIISHEGTEPDVTVVPEGSVEIELVDSRETDWLLMEHNEVRIYQTEKSCSLSDCWVSTRCGCWHEDDDAFAWEDLDGVPDQLEEKYEKLFPGDDRAQVLAYNIDAEKITEDGLCQ